MSLSDLELLICSSSNSLSCSPQSEHNWDSLWSHKSKKVRHLRQPRQPGHPGHSLWQPICRSWNIRHSRHPQHLRHSGHFWLKESLVRHNWYFVSRHKAEIGTSGPQGISLGVWDSTVAILYSMLFTDHISKYDEGRFGSTPNVLTVS